MRVVLTIEGSLRIASRGAAARAGTAVQIPRLRTVMIQASFADPVIPLILSLTNSQDCHSARISIGFSPMVALMDC